MAHIDDDIEVREARSKQFLDLWLSFRNGLQLPVWADFSPSALGPLLPNVTVLEWHGSDELLYRFADQGMVDRIGVDLTGTNFFDWVSPEARGFVMSQGRTIFDHPSGVLSLMDESYMDGAVRMTKNGVLPVSPNEAGPNLIVTHSSQIEGPEFRAEKGEGRTWMRFKGLEPIDLGTGLPDVDFSRLRPPA